MTNLAMALEGGTLDKDPFLQQYRAKRMEEMKQEARRGTKRSKFSLVFKCLITMQYIINVTYTCTLV